MCSGATRHSPPPSCVDALDPQHVRLDPLDLRAERDEEAAEILDVRLAGGVADHGLALGEDGGHDGVLGRHHARLVEEDRLAAQAGGAHLVAAVDRDLGARARRGRGCAGRAGGGRSRRRPAAARRRGRSARAAGPPSRNEARIRRQSSSSSSVLLTPRGSTRTSFSPAPLDVGADVDEQLDHRLDVADPRHVRELHGLGREHARGEDRQRAVLVPRGAHRAAERAPAFDHEGLHLRWRA